MGGSDPDKTMAKANKLTTVSLTRWTADWHGAAELYAKAANEYRHKGDFEKAKRAYEKASEVHEQIESLRDAAKHIESAAAAAKELMKYDEVYRFYKKASDLYLEHGSHQAAVDAFIRATRVLESCELGDEKVIQFYVDACHILEEDETSRTFDLYAEATYLLIKLKKFAEAASILLKWGSAADKNNAVYTQCKVYLSAIIVYLYANDLKEATKCYNDCSHIDAFVRSAQGSSATELLSAYEERDIERIKKAAASSTVTHLETVVVTLARKLPTGDVSTLKAQSDNTQLLDDENDLT